MTNEQLGVLLFHFGREINQATSQAETALRARGATLEEGMAEVLELRALANVLISQAQMLGILTPRAPTT